MISVTLQQMPLPEPPAEPKRRRPTDYSKLVLKNGRLTRTYWMLREAYTQDLRNDWVGTRKTGHYDWRQAPGAAYRCFVTYGLPRPGKGAARR
jgi:hypothetical protein